MLLWFLEWLDYYSDLGIFNIKDTNGAIWNANGCAGVPKDTATPLLSVPSLRVTLRIGKWIGMDCCGIQVGRGVAADEFANDGRNKKGANQSNSDICQCDNLIFKASKPIYLYVLVKRSTQHGRKTRDLKRRRCSRL